MMPSIQFFGDTTIVWIADEEFSYSISVSPKGAVVRRFFTETMAEASVLAVSREGALDIGII